MSMVFLWFVIGVCMKHNIATVWIHIRITRPWKQLSPALALCMWLFLTHCTWSFLYLELFPPGVFYGFSIYFTMENSCFWWFPNVFLYILFLLSLITDFFFKPVSYFEVLVHLALNVGCFVKGPFLTLECSYNLHHFDLWHSKVMWMSGIPSKYDYIKQRLSAYFVTSQNMYWWEYCTVWYVAFLLCFCK